MIKYAYEVSGPSFLSLGPSGMLLGDGVLLGRPEECVFVDAPPPTSPYRVPRRKVAGPIGQRAPGLDGTACMNCGGITVPTGSCYTCTTCGESGGCG